MVIPISNALGIKRNFSVKLNAGVSDLNNLKFESPDLKKFPLLSILKLIPNRNSYFETILTTINDNLVNKYLNGRINYISIQRNILILIKRPYFVKYYKLKPKSIYDINKMIALTNKYLESNIKNYEN